MTAATTTSGRKAAWIWLGRLLVAGAVVAAWALWFLLRGNPESYALRALLQYVPYYVYLLPALVALAWSYWLGWLWRAAALTAVLAVLLGPMGLCLGRPDVGDGRFRLMTYNAKVKLAMDRPNGLWELAQEITSHDPDVLVMQDAGEVLGVPGDGQARLKQLVGEREVFAQGQFIVASRLPLRDCKLLSLHTNEPGHAFVHCVLTVKGQDVDLITTHLTTPRRGLNAIRSWGIRGVGMWRDNVDERMRQSRYLSKYLVNLAPRPRVLAGDLNAPEGSTVVQNLLATGLRDAYSSGTTGFGFTHGHSLRPWISFLRIDHVLVSPTVGVHSIEVGGSKASEHRPIIADLLVQRHP